jgi:molybdopterin converting factor small subunit
MNNQENTNNQEPTNTNPETGSATPAPATTPETPKVEVTASAAEASPTEQVTLTFKGLVTGEIKAALGSKVKEAIKKLSSALSISSISIRDNDTGDAVGTDREVKKSMSLNVVAKASGG